ncbi:MAG TPA: hypothetical protein VIG41_04365 [Micrococcaceae bacterium]
MEAGSGACAGDGDGTAGVETFDGGADGVLCVVGAVVTAVFDDGADGAAGYPPQPASARPVASEPAPSTARIFFIFISLQSGRAAPGP